MPRASGSLLRACLHGVLLAPVLLLVLAGGIGAWYLLAWTHEARWLEARVDDDLLRMQIERWIRFRWIHPDCRYWILPVHADRGPIVLEGRPLDALYWSVTYYEHLEVNPLVSSESVTLGPDGRFRITFSAAPVGENWVPVRADAGRAVLYLRAYVPRTAGPLRLPRVTQGGRLLAEEQRPP